MSVIRKYYDDKETILKEEYFEINGIKEGEKKYYYENGKLLSVFNYPLLSNCRLYIQRYISYSIF